MKSLLTIAGGLAIISIYITGVIMLRKYRAWLTYYMFAVFGFVILLALGLQNSGWEQHIEFFELSLVSKIATFLRMEVILLPNTINVSDSVGWVSMIMGIESSALIESSILIGLISFYPAFTWQQKARYLGIGLLLTLVFNVARVLIIVTITSVMGREMIFLSHAVIGRLFFFMFIIVLFWYLLTRPTIEQVSKVVRGVNVG